MSHSTYDKPLTPVGYEQKTTFNTAAEVINIPGAQSILIQAETNNIRWRDDGIAPTGSVGMLLPAGEDFFYTGDVGLIRVIGIGADSILNISGYKASPNNNG